MRLSLSLCARKNARVPKILDAPPKAQAHGYDIRKRAASLGVRLTHEEAALLQSKASRLLPNRGVAASTTKQLTREEFHVSRRKFLRYAQARQNMELEREAMLATIEEPSNASEVSKHVFPVIGIVGTISWAIAGTQCAGQAGMHIIGCALVGCISSMGGGTVNNLLFGDAKQGVHWVKNPHTTVMVALAASVATFFTWPIICHNLAEKRLQRVHDIVTSNSWWEWSKSRLGISGRRECITKAQFLKACQHDDFFAEIRSVLPKQAGAASLSAEEIFALIDRDGNGVLDMSEIEYIVKMQYDGSTLRYMLDTISVGTSCVTGTAGAISRGLHPIVCVFSSITLCFGGIIRDLICNREIAIGSQSFAACTAAGAAVYVALRELVVRGVALPLGVRILLASSTTVALRLISFYKDEPLLTPMFAQVG